MSPFFVLLLSLILLLSQTTLSTTTQCSGDEFLDSVEKKCYAYTSSTGILTTYKRIKAQSRYTNETPLFVDIVDIEQSEVDNNSKCEEFTGSMMTGVSIDGIPIYSASVDGRDIVSMGLRRGSATIDKCGGTYGPTPDGLRYHYRVMPSCVGNMTNVADKLSSNISQVIDLFDFNDDGPTIIGYTLTGYPIYRSISIINKSPGYLDRCNGKYDSNLTFGYFATPTFPYLVGCSQRGPPNPLNSKYPLTMNSICGSCPEGYYYVIEDDMCVPCPAGRYATMSHRQSSGMSSYCHKTADPGYFALAASHSQTKCPAGR
jgi:hypothetical protein